MTGCRTRDHEARFLRLPDGRALAYEDVGPRDGLPVLHCHGIPCSRLEVMWEAASCAALGVRSICPDRPGYGLSDHLPGRSLLDWPADVAALADALEVERFGLVGVSGGGPYALACARSLPDRVTGVALVSSVAPLDRPAALQGVGPLHRFALRYVRTHPGMVRRFLRANLAVTERWPGALLRLYPCDADRQALRAAAPEIGTFGFLLESARRGIDGPLHDARVLAADWGFDPGEVQMPVELWHGDADPTIPLRHSEGLAARLPRAVLHLCPGEGHMLYGAHLPEIMRAATGAAVPTPA